jgi:hypothetical protein
MAIEGKSKLKKEKLYVIYRPNTGQQVGVDISKATLKIGSITVHFFRFSGEA